MRAPRSVRVSLLTAAIAATLTLSAIPATRAAAAPAPAASPAVAAKAAPAPVATGRDQHGRRKHDRAERAATAADATQATGGGTCHSPKCKAELEARLFPYTYTYDKGAIKVRTALDRTTVDQLYYASKQVKTQFHRVLGTDQPIAGDANTTLTVVLYASRADYVAYQPVLTGLSTDNGGMYIESTATFYTYQRRVPQDSSLTLEELFRHEYTHYLNGRFAVPGTFGSGAWYSGDRTTAMDEGTAEFFDGATRDDGIAVRKSLVQGVIDDTATGGPRMTVNQLLHATYAGDGFRFYDYAGTFYEYLWRDKPSELQSMYRLLPSSPPRP
ncbi:collagenase [Streptomyces sp. DSM 116496]|uniref:collagenase n=1 Tax=Streptomyces stoeckheimensis TaxID=3344656 RepID=UPI0038B28683